MNKSSIHSRCLRKLAGAKVKRIGIVESLKLKIAGYIDGTKGIPNHAEDGQWNSAFINREANTYEEFCSYMWALLQFENEDEFVRLGELIDSVYQKATLLNSAQKDLSIALENEGNKGVIRKKGEDKLNDAQVKARRANEQFTYFIPYRRKISMLEDELKSMMQEVSLLRCRLVEKNNTIIMICNRVKDHTLQRLDIYWNASFQKHPDKVLMPAVPSVKLSSGAEVTYVHSHEMLIQRADILYKQMAEKIADKEVA